MMIILIFRVGFNSSKTRWFSHTGSFIFSCQIAIWRFFTKTVVDYTARFYAMRGRMVKKSWHDSYHFKIVSQKCLKTAKFHQSDIQIHYGIWTVQKQFWYSKAKIITRSVSLLELGIFWGEKSKVEDRHKASSSSSAVPTILLMDVRECNLRIALRTQPLLS